jgi:hypothetical protein
MVGVAVDAPGESAAPGARRCAIVPNAYHWSLMGAHLAPRLVGIWLGFLSHVQTQAS